MEWIHFKVHSKSFLAKINMAPIMKIKPDFNQVRIKDTVFFLFGTNTATYYQNAAVTKV